MTVESATLKTGNGCPLRCPIYRHPASLNMIYGVKKTQLNVCFDHVGLRWITYCVGMYRTSQYPRLIHIGSIVPRTAQRGPEP